MKRNTTKVSPARKAKRPARKDSSAIITYVDPAHYPPALTEDEIQKPVMTQDDVDALVWDAERANRKKNWAKDQPGNPGFESASGRTQAIVIKLASPAKAGAKANANQSKRAQLPRIKVADDSEAITQIIGRLALRDDQEESPKELWTAFYGELDSRKLEPKQEDHPTHPKKSKYTYNYRFDQVKQEYGRRPITFGQFANVVSDYRTGKNQVSRVGDISSG